MRRPSLGNPGTQNAAVWGLVEWGRVRRARERSGCLSKRFCVEPGPAFVSLFSGDLQMCRRNKPGFSESFMLCLSPAKGPERPLRVRSGRGVPVRMEQPYGGRVESWTVPTRLLKHLSVRTACGLADAPV